MFSKFKTQPIKQINKKKKKISTTFLKSTLQREFSLPKATIRKKVPLPGKCLLTAIGASFRTHLPLTLNRVLPAVTLAVVAHRWLCAATSTYENTTETPLARGGESAELFLEVWQS